MSKKMDFAIGHLFILYECMLCNVQKPKLNMSINKLCQQLNLPICREII